MGPHGAILAHVLFNGKHSLLAVLAGRFVYPTICTTADEAYNAISVAHSYFGGIAGGPASVECLC